MGIALLVALILAEIAVIATSVYLHRGARAPGAPAASGHGWMFPHPALVDHGPEPTGVGRRPPQASRLHGPSGRPPQPAAVRLLEYPALERLLLRAGSTQSGHHPDVCTGYRRGLAGSRGVLAGDERARDRDRAAVPGVRSQGRPRGRAGTRGAVCLRARASDQRPGALARGAEFWEQ